jgi:hypothetical protein
VYVACQGGGVYGYAFDASNGTLTPLAGSPFSAGNAPMWVAVTGTAQ